MIATGNVRLKEHKYRLFFKGLINMYILSLCVFPLCMCWDIFINEKCQIVQTEPLNKTKCISCCIFRKQILVIKVDDLLSFWTSWDLLSPPFHRLWGEKLSLPFPFKEEYGNIYFWGANKTHPPNKKYYPPTLFSFRFGYSDPIFILIQIVKYSGLLKIGKYEQE